MCNEIHANHTIPRRKSGKGYKLFVYDSRTKEYRPFNGGLPYLTSEDGWIHWQKEIAFSHTNGLGFCFFFSIKEARRALKLWKIKVGDSASHRLKAIDYATALCRQEECYFISGEIFTTGLCRAFRIRKEV